MKNNRFQFGKSIEEIKRDEKSARMEARLAQMAIESERLNERMRRQEENRRDQYSYSYRRF